VLYEFDYDLVVRRSMALHPPADNDIDYNISPASARSFGRPDWSAAARLNRPPRLHPQKRKRVDRRYREIKADYAAQGQTILMMGISQIYSGSLQRAPAFSGQRTLTTRKRKHIRGFLLRAAKQNAIPIVNYNDPVSIEEIRKMELANLRKQGETVVECIDNDETASVICSLVHARYLVIFTSADGIYRDPNDPDTLVPVVEGKDADEVIQQIEILTTAASARARRVKRRARQAGLHQAAIAKGRPSTSQKRNNALPIFERNWKMHSISHQITAKR
jgi:glutamate 5-kinase